ncbi:MAG: alpha/beta hydrolase [Clostridia bacterium]|nr:alpha/beta hydrolase [Clostridia bacterium]
MLYWLIPLIIIAVILIATLATAYVCFFRIFYSPRKKCEDEFPIPDGKAYAERREQLIAWVKGARELPHTDVSITSSDGLKLCGKYYEYKKGAPLEILFHGHRGSAERDLSGGVYRCFELGHNALIVDHRASGHSEGKVITFGIKERRDCVDWVNFAINNIDADAKIIITGISMGAATVMMMSAMDLPSNVVGVLADCGYTSSEDIIKKVMRDMKLPADLLYPFARLGARLFGGFDLDEFSPIEAMKKCRLPIIFFHGDTDSYVPCYMSEQNFEACVSDKKRLVIIEGAEHGLCFPAAMEKYVTELGDFFADVLN